MPKRPRHRMPGLLHRGSGLRHLGGCGLARTIFVTDNRSLIHSRVTGQPACADEQQATEHDGAEILHREGCSGFLTQRREDAKAQGFWQYRLSSWFTYHVMTSAKHVSLRSAEQCSAHRVDTQRFCDGMKLPSGGFAVLLMGCVCRNESDLPPLPCVWARNSPAALSPQRQTCGR